MIKSQKQRPKVIFLDAVGTLFGVKDSVGKVYSDRSQQWGVIVAADALDQAFFHSFKTAPPPIFPGTEPSDLQQCEFNWWQNVAQRTFEQAGVLHQFSDFATFFTELYSHFATAKPWFIYPDVVATLHCWRQLGIELGVLSNFDSRLYSVLSALELTEFFSSITISTEVSAAKPDPRIFAAGLAKHHCCAESAWHIGDSLAEDFEGAKAAGLTAIWLQRPQECLNDLLHLCF